MTGPLVVKLGGSTLGAHDTSLHDIAAIHRRGEPIVVVHGGGKTTTDWLTRLGAPTTFVRGLRVTDPATLEVVVAVLAGLVNKQLVAELSALGARAVGLSGADGGLLRVTQRDPALGRVGDIHRVSPTIVTALLRDGFLPVIAPIGLGHADNALYNVNADTVAGALASGLGARQLVFLTDVAGIRGADGAIITELDADTAQTLIMTGVIDGGMIPKVEACVAAGYAQIVDGRIAGALLAAATGRFGTLVRATERAERASPDERR